MNWLGLKKPTFNQLLKIIKSFKLMFNTKNKNQNKKPKQTNKIKLYFGISNLNQHLSIFLEILLLWKINLIMVNFV